MKIQSLAIMFIILILPISLVLASYTQTRVETLSLQTRYDSKLKDATYDALKAYQLNSLNSDTSDLSNAEIRNVEASVNTFFNTMSTNFSSLGYTKETLQNYVPALVYTMYDGYYIYTPFTNTWDEETINIVKEQEESYRKEGKEYSETYKNDKKLYDLKPYVYYSCRYKRNNIDVVITYSLDNYIQIQGTINGKTVSKYGYLLDEVEVNNENITYRGLNIDTEKSKLYEYVCIEGNIKELEYAKINGVKYYIDNGKVFSVLKGNKYPANITVEEIQENNNAKNYYKEAYELKRFIKENGLDELETSDIVNEDGKKYDKENNPYYNVGKIFDFDSSVESETSNFNTHRIDVIKNSIERNLSIVISNFNNYSGVSTNFQMPKLKDSDWDKIMDNISIISFMQGINIGGKVYNGYSIITNTKNEDVVMEDSIYIKNNGDNTFHRVTEEGLATTNIVGIYNVNLERRSGEDSQGNTIYYFPAFTTNGTLSYDSIVTQNKVSDDSINKYLDGKGNLAKVYYTALGRERYGLYRQKLEIDNTQ